MAESLPLRLTDQRIRIECTAKFRWRLQHLVNMTIPKTTLGFVIDPLEVQSSSIFSTIRFIDI